MPEQSAVRRYLNRIHQELEAEWVDSGMWFCEVWKCPKCGSYMFAEQTPHKFGGGFGGGKGGCCWMMGDAHA